ncbi:MAG: multiubiquitin domain-containing protein [Acidimicrobiales bacterium]
MSQDDPASERPHEHEFHIQIDREHFTVRKEELTGEELRNLPRPPVPADRDLFEVRPGESDLLIEDTTVVKIHDGLRFFTAPSHINPGAYQTR